MKKLFYLFAILFAVLFAACESTEPPTSNKVETGASENITKTSATLKGVVNVDIADYNSVEFGIMYDTLLAEVNNRSAQMIKGSVLMGKDFSINLADLTENTKYYYCAYLLLNGMQYEFGAVKEFVTLASNDTPDVPENPDTPDMPENPDTPDNPSGNSSNGHVYVDLGLSVKWATCNVGANAPEEYGDYFAWGETQPKDYYDWSMYKWCNGSYDNLTKYCTDSNYGKVDNKTVLDLEDDAAHVNWGGEWRMPTIEEQQELVDYCTWKWTKVNGKNGYTVTGPNGNSIFLPAAGDRDGSDFFNAGSYGYYWSSSLTRNLTRNSYYACSLYFGSGGASMYYNRRIYGQSVRPVTTFASPQEPNKPSGPSTPGSGSYGSNSFSVSARKTVTFSPGNLQYHPANDEWRFAPNQTDYIGEANANISSSYNGWIDLFGWGTGNNPTNESTDDNDYRTFVDWGVNKISNYAPNTWRTLTYYEWKYIIEGRDNADKLIGVAQVNGVNGLILLPDSWTCPSGVTFKSGFHEDHGIEYYAAYQTFGASEWATLEASGAVFFPAAGGRGGYVQYYGNYWSASGSYSYGAYYLIFFSYGEDISGTNRSTGRSVRLVQD